jgi:hypothetical protein
MVIMTIPFVTPVADHVVGGARLVVAVFPGTLEKLFGLGYDFHDEWASHVRGSRR